MNNLLKNVYNPDILNCLANLSNDEVFTPPEVANQMLDTLPQELFENPDTKFLDPCCKTGVFLREIAKRLNKGLEKKIPDLNERIEHILKYQLYGIAITEITSLMSRRSLYCSKFADGKYSLADFDNVDGNVRFKLINHTWENGKCIYCGAPQSQYDRDDDLETHAYELIHTKNPEEIFKMKFDVIIGNPPYQLSDGGGNGTSAMPIYHKFVEHAMKLNPHYLTMIMPSRWFSGGKGLDEFRYNMLHDNHIREIHDFPEASDCFPGVQIKGGVCFFLWDSLKRGNVTVYTHRGNNVSSGMSRPLLEENCDTFIRYNEAVEILRKIEVKKSFEDIVSYRRPFNIDSDINVYSKKTDETDVLCYKAGGKGYIKKDIVKKNSEWIKKYKVYIAKAGSGSDSFPHPILGIPFLGNKDTVCSETYLVVGPFNTKEECENVISYIKTRFFRFLVHLIKNTQNAARAVYAFVPMQDFSKSWTDEELYEKYKLTKEEIEFIESLIRPMDTEEDND